VVGEALGGPQTQIGQRDLVGVVAETWAADVADAVLPAGMVKRCRCSPLHPNAACNTVCRSAIVVVADTSRRRQLSGLTPATTTRS